MIRYLPLLIGAQWVTTATLAETIHVPDDHPTIQQAIDAATDGDRIIVQPGTYHEQIDFNGRAISLQSIDPFNSEIVRTTRIDGSRSTGSIVRIHSVSGSATELAGFTITNGDAAEGAGVHIINANPIIRQCIFIRNDSYIQGAAIDGILADARIDSCRFLGNTGSSTSSVVRFDLSSLLVANCTFSGNLPACMAVADCDADVINCSFHANESYSIQSWDSTTSLINCVKDFSYYTSTATLGDIEVHHCANLGNVGDSSNFLGEEYFVQPDGPDGIAGTMDDDLSLNRFSPCTDRGDNAAAKRAGLAFDANAHDRFVDDGSIDDLGEGAPVIDIGAFERQVDSTNVTFIVTPDDSIAGTLEVTTAGDTIELQPGVYTERINPMSRPVTVRSVDPCDPDVVAVTILQGDATGEPIILCDLFETTDTVFEGLTLTGNHDSAVLMRLGEITMRDCVIRDNFSQWGAVECNGKDMFLYPVFERCRFLGNHATGFGGAMYLDDTAAIIIDCEFSGNSATLGGGAIVFGPGGDIFDSRLINCTFSGNTAIFDSGGAAWAIDFVEPEFVNCIFRGNHPNQLNRDNLTVSYSLVEGGYPGIGNIDADPLFLDADGPDNILGTLDDDTRLSPGSPAIDAASNSAYEGTELLDLDGNPRFVNDACTDDTGEGQRPIIDMGAYEFQPCIADINCDDTVTVDDLLLLLSSWGACTNDCPADITNDTTVDTNDLLQLLAQWSDC